MVLISHKFNYDPIMQANDFLFTYHAPLAPLRGFISIPHSGEVVPEEMQPYLTSDQRAWKEDVDYKVHELIDIKSLNQMGVAILVSHIHRIAVDLNRPENISVLWWEKNTQGVPLITTPSSMEDKLKWQGLYYRPYYEMIKSIIEQSQSKQYFPVIDLHSMPSRPTAYHMNLNPQQKNERPDFCLSNKTEKKYAQNITRTQTCEDNYLHFLQQQLTACGYAPALNDPYKGGNINAFMSTFHTQSCQIEINRKLYMDEKTKELLSLEKVAVFKKNLTNTLLQLFERFAITE